MRVEGGEEKDMAKIAIVLHAEPGSHDSLGRAVHSLIYTKELREAGHQVKLSVAKLIGEGYQVITL